MHRYQSASAFTAVLSMTKIERSGGSVNDWVDNRPQVSIKASNDGDGGRELISGKCDAAEADWLNRTVHIEGRDATANLLDTNIDPQKDQFKNKSPDDIVKEIAGRAGLSMEGGGGGGGGGSRAGRKHTNDEYNLITGHQSLFNIIQRLAESEGKTFWVEGKKLFWQDVGGGSGGGGSISIRYRKPGPASPQGNFTGLKTIRNFTAEEAKADVSSYQTREKEVVGDGAGGAGEGGGGGGEGSGDSGEGGGGGGSSDGAKMKLQTHNQTQEQAEKAGKSITAAAQQHALRIIYEGPGDANADPRMTVSLSGTGTVFDDSYDCDSIRHVFSGEGASYVMTVDARTKGSGGGE